MKATIIALLPFIILMACKKSNDVQLPRDTTTTVAASPRDTPRKATSDETVAFTFTPHVQGRSVVIDGTTDLPDGTWISYEIDPKTLGIGTPVDGATAVKKGKYHAIVQVDFSGGAEAWAAFQTVLGSQTQPKAIIDRFGDLGQNLTGPNVTTEGTSLVVKRVEITHDITIH